jgi:hypothetical protein
LRTRPHEDTILFIHRQMLGVDKFVFHIFQVVVIQIEAAFQCPVRDTLLSLE